MSWSSGQCLASPERERQISRAGSKCPPTRSSFPPASRALRALPCTYDCHTQSGSQVNTWSRTEYTASHGVRMDSGDKEENATGNRHRQALSLGSGPAEVRVPREKEPRLTKAQHGTVGGNHERQVPRHALCPAEPLSPCLSTFLSPQPLCVSLPVSVCFLVFLSVSPPTPSAHIRTSRHQRRTERWEAGSAITACHTQEQGDRLE